MLDLLQLKYFMEVAKREHLNKAAQILMVSPSALSSSISRLEKELGVVLFDRIGRNIQLNQFGKIYLSMSQTIFKAIEDAQNQAALLQQQWAQTLSIAITSPLLWEGTLKQFSERYPDIHIQMTAFDTGAEQIISPPDDVDVIIASPDSLSSPDWICDVVINDQVLLAVPPQHPFASLKEIDLAMAKDEWFVNLPTNTFFRSYCEELCKKAGFTPKSKIECDYMLRPQLMINENMVCITTQLSCRTRLFDNLVTIPITSPVCRRRQAIFWQPNRRKKQSIQWFKSFVLEIFRDYNSKVEEAKTILTSPGNGNQLSDAPLDNQEEKS